MQTIKKSLLGIVSWIRLVINCVYHVYMDEISHGPNFLNAKSKDAESAMKDLLNRAIVLGVERTDLPQDKQEIIETIKDLNSERFDLVAKKLLEERLSVDDLSKDELLDRMLGIDFLVRSEGKTIAIDVTSGKGTVLHNKKEKMNRLKEVYKALGIDHAVVVRINRELNDDSILDLFSRIEESLYEGNQFCTVVNFRAK